MNFAHPWLGILKSKEIKEETENLFIVPKASQDQVGPEGEGLMDPQPNLAPDSVHLKNESIKKPRALQVRSEAFEWFMLWLMIVEFNAIVKINCI